MIRDYFTDTVSLYSPAFGVSTTTGDTVTTWTLAETFKGKVRPLSASEQYVQNKRTVVTTHRLYCDNTTINESYKVVCSGSTYDITGIINPMGFNRFLQVDMRISS